MKFIPHNYQDEAITFLSKHPEAALFLDPGLGKSVITLAAFVIALARRSGQRMLVFAPLRVCSEVWSKTGEVGKWDAFKDLRVSLLHGNKKEAALAADADIYVINYEGVDWLTGHRQKSRAGQAPIDVLARKGVTTLVFDELSKMRNSQANRFKQLKPHLRRFARRWGLTGSPAANSLLALQGECFMIDHGKALGEYITHYRAKYFHPTKMINGVFVDWAPNTGAPEKIYEAIKPFTLSMRATDHLPGLPKLVEQDIWIDLPADARAFYEELEEELIATLAGETITAAGAGVVTGKCRQIASGWLYVDGTNILDIKKKRTTREIHTAKIDALVDLVDELQGAPLLLAFEFQHEIELIRKAFKNVPAICGGVDLKKSAGIFKTWNAGEIPLLAAQSSAAAHGLNLQESSCGHVAFLTLPWDREVYDQLIARAWRQGNKAKRVIVHRILARGTVDEALVAPSLTAKGLVQNSLFDALKTYLKEKRK